MRSFSIKSCAVFLSATAVTALLMQACGGSSSAVAQAASDADPAEGTWESAITIRDCTSGTTLTTFIGVSQFARGGTLTATNNQPPASQNLAFGNWKRNVGGGYTSSFRFFRFAADGHSTGTQKVTRTLTLSVDGNAMTGSIAAQIVDPSGALLQTICGTETATRLF